MTPPPRFDAFGPGTIDDDDDSAAIPTYDSDSDEEPQRIVQTKQKKQKKNQKGAAKKASSSSSSSSAPAESDDDNEQAKKRGGGELKSTDLNPDFVFSLDTVGPGGVVHAWDFADARSKLRQRSVMYTSIDDKIAKRVKTAGDEDEEDEEGEEDEIMVDAEAEAEHKRDEQEAMDVDAEVDEGESSGEEGESSSEDEAGSDDDDDEDVVREREMREEKRKADFFEEVAEPDQDDLPTTFGSMNLSRPVIKGLSHLGFTAPTIIQARAIPIALMGKDIVGGAVTGSGKTLAFMIPILERLLYRPKANPVSRVLVLTPTRELAIQCHSVATKVSQFTDITIALAVGGLNVKQQEAELKKRPDIVIATPGRLIDFIHNSSSFTLDTIEILVMDEADRMLEDGFADELNEIVKNTPRSRQTMLFSATMTDNIDQLIRMSLTHPVRLFIDSRQATSHRLIQEFIRVRPQREEDRPAILLALCSRTFKEKCIVFFKSKVSAHQMKVLFGLHGLKAAELHGNLTQEQRMDALEQFRDSNVDFLLATDLAARGIDIKGIETVINYNVPSTHIQYLHRVGRTARAGRGGRAVSLVGEADRKLLRLVIKNATSADQIKHRVIPAAVLDKYAGKVEAAKDDIRGILKEEYQERELRQAEQQLNKAQNLVDHKAEIMARPKREWFQSNKDRERAKQASAADLGLDKSVKAAADAALARKLPHAATDGMSRRKKRKLMMDEDDKMALGSASAAARSAKKSARPQRLATVAEGGAAKSLGGHQPPAKKRKVKGFESDLAGGRRSVGGASSARKSKSTGGKGKAMSKIKNKSKQGKKAGGKRR